MDIRTNVRIGGNYMKRYVIKSKIRFLISISLIMIFTVTSLFTLVVNARVNQDTPMALDYVETGDTLWNMSEEYAGDMDIREYISKVIGINDLNSSNIKPGELLYFPIYK